MLVGIELLSFVGSKILLCDITGNLTSVELRHDDLEVSEFSITELITE
jgi:hypothetical protein